MGDFFNNCSFLLLLCSMIFYWICAFFHISIFSYIGKWTIIGANLTMFILLTYQGFIKNHFPLTNQKSNKNTRLTLYKIISKKI